MTERSKMNDIGIYAINNFKTGDRYIGQSIHMSKRRKEHFSDLCRGTHKNSHLQHSYNKYGRKYFTFKILLYCEPFELTRYEQLYVNIFNPAYNICKDCVDSLKGVLHSEEHKAKISAANKGRYITEEWKAHLSAAHKGMVLSEEHKAKISAACMGKTGHAISEATRAILSVANMGNKNMLGKRHTDESKAIMSLARIGKMGHPISEAQKAKLSANRKGKKRGAMSDECKAKIGAAHKGKKRPDGTGKRISDALKGRKFSDATRKKLSLSHMGKPSGRKGKFKDKSAIQNNADKITILGDVNC